MVPVSAIIAFLLLGIEEIGVQIEEPFGILPLGQNNCLSFYDPCLVRLPFVCLFHTWHVVLAGIAEDDQGKVQLIAVGATVCLLRSRHLARP